MDKAFFENKLKNCNSEVLLEIIETSIRMDEGTKFLFLVYLEGGEITLLKDQLAEWLTLHQEN